MKKSRIAVIITISITITIGLIIGILLVVHEDKPNGVFCDPIPTPTYDDNERTFVCYTDIFKTINITEDI
jgi:hypothetical protein